MAMKLGTTVQQVLPAPVKGRVDDVVWDAEVMKFKYLVTFANENGAQQRWFWADEVAAVEGDAQ